MLGQLLVWLLQRQNTSELTFVSVAIQNILVSQANYEWTEMALLSSDPIPLETNFCNA